MKEEFFKNSNSVAKKYNKEKRKLGVIEEERKTGLLHSMPSEAGLSIFKVNGKADVIFKEDSFISTIPFPAGSGAVNVIREKVAARNPREAVEIVKRLFEQDKDSRNFSSYSFLSLKATYLNRKTTKSDVATFRRGYNIERKSSSESLPSDDLDLLEEHSSEEINSQPLLDL